MGFYTVCITTSVKQYMTVEADSFDKAYDGTKAMIHDPSLLKSEEIYCSYSDVTIASIKNNETQESKYYA